MILDVHSRGDGLPVVVLPSFSLGHSAMTSVVEPAFAELTGYRRLYVDLPGTGVSPSGEPSSEAVLADVTDTIRHELADQRLAVVGWSYGGFLAAGVSRRMSSHVCGLMMVCSGFRIRPQDRDLTGVLPSEPERDWLTGVPSRWHEHFSHAIGYQSAEVARRVAQVLDHNDRTDEAFLADLRANGFVLPDQDFPGPRDIPVCFLAGWRDRVAGYLSVFNAAGEYDDASFVASSRAGHYLPVEDPALFSAALGEWLGRYRRRINDAGANSSAPVGF